MSKSTRIDLQKLLFHFYFLLGAYCLGGVEVLGFTAVVLGCLCLVSTLIESYYS